MLPDFIVLVDDLVGVVLPAVPAVVWANAGAADIASTTAPVNTYCFIDGLLNKRGGRSQGGYQLQNAEAADDREQHSEQRRDDADDRPDEVIAALARHRVEERRGRVAAQEAAEVGRVVDARHDQAEDEQDHRIAKRRAVGEA